MTTVEQAINESVLHNCIVHMEDASVLDIEDLKRESDDWVENGPVIEFWGRDDDGENWRVHAEPKGK